MRADDGASAAQVAVLAGSTTAGTSTDGGARVPMDTSLLEAREPAINGSVHADVTRSDVEADPSPAQSAADTEEADNFELAASLPPRPSHRGEAPSARTVPSPMAVAPPVAAVCGAAASSVGVTPEVREMGCCEGRAADPLPPRLVPTPARGADTSLPEKDDGDLAAERPAEASPARVPASPETRLDEKDSQRSLHGGMHPHLADPHLADRSVGERAAAVKRRPSAATDSRGRCGPHAGSNNTASRPSSIGHREDTQIQRAPAPGSSHRSSR